jgi:MFS family permease
MEPNPRKKRNFWSFLAIGEHDSKTRKNFIRTTIGNIALIGQNYYNGPILLLLLLSQGIDPSLIMGITFVTAIVFRPLSGWLSDIKGRRKVTLFAFLALGIALGSYSFSAWMTVWVLIFVRILHGAAQASAGTALQALQVEILPSEQRGKGLGLSASIAFASLPAVTAVSLILQPIPFLWGIVGAAMVFVAALFIKKVKIEEKASPRTKITLSNLVERRTIPWAIGALGIAIIHGGVYSLIPVYVQSLHQNSTLAWYFYLTYALMIIVSRFIVGWLSDKKKSFLLILVALALALISTVGGLLFLAFPLKDLVVSLLLAGTLIGFGYSAIHQVLLKLAFDSASGERHGVVSSTYMSAYDLALGIGPIYLYVAHMVGFSLMWRWMIPCLLLVAIGVLLGMKKSSS